MALVSAARSLRLSQTCDVKRVPSGSNPAARETVVAGLRCSAVYPASQEQAERAGMALAVRLMVVYTADVAPPTPAVQPDWRLVTGGVDYRIRAVSRWPRGDAQFVELLIEEE